jgi:protein O-mannosyl-transferase
MGEPGSSSFVAFDNSCDQPMRYGTTEGPLIRSWQIGLFALLLVSLTILAYQPAWHGGFLWDDDAYVVNNDLLTARDGLHRIWFSLESPSQYFPLVYTTFRIERALWGLNPTGYHLVNIFLHAANALLVWRLLLRLRVPGAWLAAAIFALHPVQVESVAWITERKNVLMGFFFLLTLLAWIEFIDPESKRRWRFYVLALVLYALALFSKTTACTLPAALLLILWLQKRPIDKQRLTQIVPFLFLGIAMGLLTVWWERYHQGTRGLQFALGPIERLLIASRAVWFYLSKLVWPSNLTFIYPRWTVSAAHLIDYIWLVAAGVLFAAIYFARRYLGRSVEVAALFFVATLSPVIGFIMLYTFRYTFAADHYQYLASIGPIALVSAGVANLVRPNVGRYFLFASAACALAVLTWRQSSMYADIEDLWRTTITRNPGCWMAYNNLGIVLFQKGEIDSAIGHYQKTLEMKPDFADAEYNLGNALVQKGQIDEGLLHAQRAATLKSNDPEVQVGLGNALLHKGLVDQAIAHYEKALTLRPYYFAAHYNLSAALLEKGDLDAAIFHCRSALSIQPEYGDAYTRLAIALAEKGQPAEAIRQYEKALQIAPESISAQTNLAWLLATCPDGSLRDGNRALELVGRANQVSGGTNPFVLRSLAAAYAEVGQFAKAAEIAQQAERLASAKSFHSLVPALEEERKLYQANMPFREATK